MDLLDDKPTSVKLNKHHRRILDELRRRETGEIPSQSGMIRLLIERADPHQQKDKRK